MTVDRCDLADYEWLIGEEAAGVLRDLADRTASPGSQPLHAAAGQLRRHFSAERTHLLLEQVDLRRRAADKFAAADRMFFTRLGLEQATDEWVARYKAARFAALAGTGPLADLCCGIGGDMIALAECGPVVGVDRDPVAACFAAANASAASPEAVSANVQVSRGEAESFDARGFAAVHIDPDRRPAGHRTTSVEWNSPNQDAIERLFEDVPHAAIKLAPAAEAPATWAERCELEWIGRDRQCRQQVAWYGELAVAAGKRRATVLARDGRTLRSIVGEPNQPTPFVEQLDRYLFEPDTAVLAAHLPGVVAAEHGLAIFSAGVAYLTGPQPTDDPAVACFEILDVLSLKPKLLAQYVAKHRIGQLEIKKRGVEHDPKTIRKQLKLSGDRAATLILTKLRRKRVAIFARRAEAQFSPPPASRILHPSHATCL